jgi:hypothetical protein
MSHVSTAVTSLTRAAGSKKAVNAPRSAVDREVFQLKKRQGLFQS